MSTNEPTYAVVSQVPTSKWVEGLQRVVEGWTITVRSIATSVLIPVFVPGHTPDPVAADQAILVAVAASNKISQLGG